MFRKLITFILSIVIIISFTSCNDSAFKKYDTLKVGPFDTYVKITAYTKNESEFKEYSEKIISRVEELNEYYDIYNNYEGINNIKTINDNAGIAPVKVNDDILKLIEFSIKGYNDSDGAINIALGPVLSIWHEYREKGLDNPALAELPPMDRLVEASKNCDINNIIINENEKTVFLKESGMSLDVGAVAKGYAAQIAIDEAKELGLTSCIIDMGGNIVTLGKPIDRDKWTIGIENPNKKEGNDQNIIDSVSVNTMAIVTSGIYQRNYVVDGKEYHHIIDQTTLMPAAHYSSLTVVCENSGMADMLSTALFTLPYDESFKLAEKFNVAAIWVLTDGTIKTNDLYNAISKKYGGNN